MKGAAFVGASRAIERELKAAGYPRPRIHFLPDGVPIPPPRTAAVKARARAVLAEASAALEMPHWAPLAVYTGRLQPSQGLQKLVAAWGPVAARWPNGRLWLAGGGPGRAALRQQIEALNLTDRVVPIDVFDEVDELLTGADLFVSTVPSAGTSVSLLEAMAAGLPVVAGDTPGNRDLISDGRDGLLVPVDDTDAVSEGIIRLIDQPDLAAGLGAAARQHAVEEFSLAKMVEKHVTLFERLVHQHPNTAVPMPVGRDTP
jgi:glycosyltransferase involved in cell wall biosynthesis